MVSSSGNGNSRRDFLKQASCAAAASATLGALAARSYAAGDETIQIVLIGCGGRGTGAARNALSTKGPVKLVAMADVFENRLKGSLGHLSKNHKDKVDVTPERCFVGFDAYKKAIDCIAPGGVALLTTPPAFRPLHLEYAVAKGCNVFMEKSFAVDAPGIRRVIKAGKDAEEKNLKIAGGLMSRHYKPLEEAVEQIHNGAIGTVVTAWAYRMHGDVGFARKPEGMSDLMHQIRNYSCYTWVNGSFLLDWLIHNLDVSCWVKGAWPVSAQGQGGRQARSHPDQLFDHYAAEYTFPDGTRLLAQGRHIRKCWGFFGDVIHGATGCAILGEGQSRPRIWKGHQPTNESLIWSYKGPGCNCYQVEHDLLFDAIRADKPYNEAERCAKAAMTGILGRMACESGQRITWDQAMASNLKLAPDLDNMTFDSEPPVKPDGKGRYPIAMPGATQVL